MATKDELDEALADFAQRCNENQRLRRMQRDWTRNILIRATDNNIQHTMVVVKGYTTIEEGQTRPPDIIITADSELLCDMWWGDLNPAESYLQGTLKVQATQEDIMRLDAVTAVIWGYGITR